MAVNKEMPILVVDGEDALSKISAKDYALILSDWNMEPKSGIELLRDVRQAEKHKNMPFILITAESKVENIVEAKKAGVNQHIMVLTRVFEKG